MTIPFPQRPKTLRTVYLDHAAATQIDPAVLRAMRPYLTTEFANPSPLYRSAVNARQAIEQARAKAADLIGAQSDCIVFTSSGTESVNMAILGTARAYEIAHNQTGHIITTPIEHHAVLESVRALKRQGWRVTYLPVDRDGLVRAADVVAAFQPDTILVSIMYANNEIGTIEPIADIGKEILKWRKKHSTVYPYFHTDACQAASYLDLTVERLHVDLMTVNASKLYGPKGSAFLYTRRGTVMEPLIYGGGQESGLRSGTENVAAIVGFARACEMSRRERDKESVRISALRDYFWQELQKQVSNVVLNGPDIATHAIARLPNNLNVTFPGIEAEALILYLDTYGIACSSGSACATHDDETSHVLRAIGVDAQVAQQTVRFSLGKYTTKKDIDYVLTYLPAIVRSIAATATYTH